MKTSKKQKQLLGLIVILVVALISLNFNVTNRLQNEKKQTSMLLPSETNFIKTIDKCGEGKCGNDKMKDKKKSKKDEKKQTKSQTNNDKKCGEGKARETKKCGNGKCGDGKNSNNKKAKDQKCGTGKCGKS